MLDQAAATGTVVYETTAGGFDGARAPGFDSDYDLGAPRGNAGPGGAIAGPLNGAVYFSPAAGANPGPAEQQVQQQQQPPPQQVQPSRGINRGGRKGSVYDGFESMDV